MIFALNGYKRLYKLCDTLQGELFKAEVVKNKLCKSVVIKKTDKAATPQADNGRARFGNSESILKEASIVKYLTVNHIPIGDYIVKFIDSFESDTDYYLVLEYVESEMNLRQFVDKAHGYIKDGKLPIKSYRISIKYLLWQLFVTITWLHQSMHCMSSALFYLSQNE